jgi:hypothetical protein
LFGIVVVAALGASVILATFESQEATRATILEQIISRIDAHSKSAGFFANLMRQLIDSNPDTVNQDILPKVHHTH